MHIINKLAIKNLKLNKKRSIGTIIGIILSVALICAVTGIFTSFQKSLVTSTINNTGYYHLILYNKNQNDIDIIKNNRDIQSINILNSIGYAKNNLNTTEQPYFHIYSFENQKSFAELSIKLEEGHYPQNSSEIILNSEVTYINKYQIGDKITLDVGKRVSFDGYELNEINPITEEETINDSETKEFKIVGFFRRNYALEPHSDPGISSITLSNEGQISAVYLALKNPLNYEEDFSQILNIPYTKNSPTSTDDYAINSELLRWETFKFSDNTIAMIYSIITIILIIIIGTSIFCIKNSFDISTTEKRKMYGMLLSIGATPKQIKKSIIKEGLLLGIIAIPLGIIFGVLAVFILVNLINHLISDLSKTKVIFYINIIPIFFALILGLLTIYISSLASSKKTKKISPIEYIRNSDDIKIKNNQLHCPKFIGKIFKTGGVIAYKNLKRSKKKYRTTVISLTISILTFIAFNSFITYGINTTKHFYENIDYDIQINSDKESACDLFKVLNLPGIKEFNFYQTSSEYLEITDKNKITKYAQENIMKEGDCHYDEETDIYNCVDDQSLGIQIVSLNKDAYKRYIKKLGLSYQEVHQKGILINNYLYFIDGVEVMNSIYSYQKNDTIKGTYQNNVVNIPISLVTDIRPSGLEKSYYDGGYLIVEEGFNNYEYYPTFITLKVENPEQFTKDVKNNYPQLNIQNIQNLVKAQSTISLISQIFLYGFITVITLIGITNIFNTITSNIYLRGKEFAMLKSMGMTKKEFNNMINLETFFYSTKALFYGLTLGLIGSFIIYKSFAKRIDFGYQLPIIPLLISIIFVFVLVFFIMKYSVKKINKQNIIETIRKENI